MTASQKITVPPMSAAAFVADAGQTVRITDVQGRQAGDFVALSAADLSMKLSQARTRVENGKVAVTAGDTLWTNTFPPEVMFTIVGDTYGAHDLLYPPCCRYALEKRFGVSHDGCLENLARALEPWAVRPRDIPDPLNLFFHVSVDDAGGMVVDQPTSATGASIELKAEMDCIVAVSTCAVPAADRDNTEYRIEILEG